MHGGLVRVDDSNVYNLILIEWDGSLGLFDEEWEWEADVLDIYVQQWSCYSSPFILHVFFYALNCSLIGVFIQ